MTAKLTRRTFTRGLCSIWQDPAFFTMVRDLREQGLIYARIAAGTGLSRWTVAHHEAHRLAPAAPPDPKTGCVVCDLGAETQAVVFHARRQRKSIPLIATAVGVSRAALQAHLRRCVPVALGLNRHAPESYGARAVATALARLEQMGPPRR